MKVSSLKRACALVLSLPAACALFTGPAAQAQPTLNFTYPDGTLLFQATNSLQINASSVTGITNFAVTLLATNLDGIGTSNNLTAGNGFTVSGSGPGVQIATVPLSNNYFYSAVITIKDSGGAVITDFRFDTITPSFLWEAEDYDYDSGHYLADPQTNGYFGLYATLRVDAFNPNGGSQAYRPINDGTDNGADLATEVTGDVPRAGYAEGGFADYDVGYNGSGNWGNYTRKFPQGKWNIYGRLASWATGGKNLLMYQGGPNGELLGQLNVPNTQTNGNEYQVYTWVPVSDVAGNPIEWDSDGSVQTLTTVASSGNYNANFFILMPIDTNYTPKPFISNVNPDSSTNVFTPTNVFSFVANSIPGLQTSNVVLTANGITPNGVVYSGSAHSLNVSFPMQSNVVYTISVSITDANGSSTYNTVVGTFQTNNYTWECEDWDYNGGSYIDNPQTDAYVGLSGLADIDANNTQGGNSNYRTSDGSDLGNEVTGDAKRAQYTKLNTNDYDIGWTANGNWANYTRHYQPGVYNVYLRVASPNGQNDAITLYWVTNGVGTASQGLSAIGQFNAPLTGGYQNWSWTPLVDQNGNLVTVTNTSAAATIRMNEDNGGFNGNFFMLVPPDTQRPTLTGLYPNGKTQFQRANALSFTVNSPIALTASAVTLTVNGVVQTNAVFGGTPNALTVSWPLQPNQVYSVSIVVNNPDNDSTSASFTFDTFSSSYYTFEAEDFDFTNGLSIDNPQIDLYAGLSGTPGVDANDTQNGNSDYRPNDAGDLATEVTGDSLRSQYVTDHTNDYDVGWTAATQWANYTRHYPQGSYHVWARIASPSGQANALSFSQVTSGVGTGTQTTNLIGTFNAPATGGYQSWTFTPLVDSSGTPVTVTTTGAKTTFQAYQNYGGFNMNYFMLVPLVDLPTLSVGYGADQQHLSISWSGSGVHLYSSPTLGSGAVWTVVGTNNPATVPISGASQFFAVGK